MRKVDYGLVDNLLREWALWVNDAGNFGRLGHRRSSVYAVVAGGGVGRSMLNDDDAMCICDEMVALKNWQPDFFQVMDMFYRRGMSKVKISEKLGVDRRWVGVALEAGSVFVARGFMSGIALRFNGVAKLAA